MDHAAHWLRPTHTPFRVWTARAIAVAADAVQLGLFPLFAPGAVSPIDDALDVMVAVAMIALLGWNWAFLPAVVAEMVPLVDLVPSWTAAVLFATRRGAVTNTVGFPLEPK